MENSTKDKIKNKKLKGTRVVLLGTGNPTPDPERSGPSVAIIVNKTPYIIDCGPGVVRRIAAAWQTGIPALKMSRLRTIFITHLHSDHTVGYPDLIFTPWVTGRFSPLDAYGPKGLQAMTDNIQAAYQQDIRGRIEGLEPINERGYQVKVHEISPGIIYDKHNTVVEAFPVKHGPFISYGYKFTTPDKTIIISGDTAPIDSLVDIYRDCDILIHEIYSHKKFLERQPNWQEYHSSMHTSTKELAEIALKARPGLIILYHQLHWGAKEEDLLAEIREIYDGKVVSGKDLEIY